MRIVIFTNAGIGLYKFRKELVEDLCRENEVYVVLPNDEFIEPLKAVGCKVILFDFARRGINPFADLCQIKRYVNILRELKANIVLTYTIKPNVYGGIACQIVNVPYIANITGLGTAIQNGGLLKYISMGLYKVGLRNAKCIFFQNRYNQKLFMNKNIGVGRCRLIPGSGVNLNTHKLEKYPDEMNGIRFLFVGRIMRDKGIEELLTAIKNIHSIYKNVTLDIVGWCDEDYMKEIKSAEKTGAIHFYGRQTDVHLFYTACHCAVLPSYHEGTANVMLEASSTGRPVITTRIPGCQETFDENITGFGCEVRNSKSLEEAMIRFIVLPQCKREEMGLAARAKMEREYDRNIVLNAYKQEITKTFIKYK